MIPAELCERVTAAIVARLSDPGEWSRPWACQLPVNAVTGAAYSGVNLLMLWCEAASRGYTSSEWGTFRQWAQLGGQVRKGERAVTGIVWKSVQTRPDADGERRTYRLARAFSLFNRAQVDGLPADVTPAPVADVGGMLSWLDAVVPVEHGGDRAAYVPGADLIVIPPAAAFVSDAAYLSTRAHEVVRWSGAPGRLARDLSGRFGSELYAAEELVAELGAAFLCAHFGVAAEPRADHAVYIAGWLRAAGDDPGVLVTAASSAQAAVRWLLERVPAVA